MSKEMTRAMRALTDYCPEPHRSILLIELNRLRTENAEMRRLLTLHRTPAEQDADLPTANDVKGILK